MKKALLLVLFALCLGACACPEQADTVPLDLPAPECSDPLLGYDSEAIPFGTLHATAIDAGGITAAVLAPFPVTTTCQQVIVGGSIIGALAAPPSVTIATFDTLDPESPEGPVTYTTIMLDSQYATDTMIPTIREYRLPIKTTHQAHLTPFVGSVVIDEFEPGTLPTCTPPNAARYRANEPYKGWSPLSEDAPGVFGSGVHASLYYGLAECGVD